MVDKSKACEYTFDYRKQNMIREKELKTIDNFVPEGKTCVAESEFYFRKDIIIFMAPDSLKRIEAWAFAYCTGLREVYLGENVEYISPLAFDACDSLEWIEVSEKNPYYMTVDGVLYSKDGNTIIRYPEKKRAVSFAIPDYVTTVGENAFNRCRNLTEVLFSENVTELQDKSFAYCTNLQKINLPAFMRTIGNAVFADCYCLKEFRADGNQYHWIVENGVLFREESDRLFLKQFPLGKEMDEYTVDRDVCKIAERAFSCAAFLRKIKTDICQNFYQSDAGVLYSKDMKRLIYYPSRKEGTFFDMPDCVETICNSSVKQNRCLKKVLCSRSLQLIERHALEECSSLEKIVFRGCALRRIEWSAFCDCIKLEEVDFSKQCLLKEISSFSFLNCSSMRKVSLPPSAPVIRKGAFKNCALLRIPKVFSS